MVTDVAVTASLNVVIPALFTFNTSSVLVPPTISAKVTLPVPDDNVRSRGVVSLSRISVNTILPNPVLVSISTSPVTTTAVAKLILEFVVLMSPANSLVPAPI